MSRRVDFADEDMTEEDWLDCMRTLVELELVTWKEASSLILGHLNPPQVGTALASSIGFKRNYGKGNTWPKVREWLYNQSGRCVDCGTRLELQADHTKPKEEFRNPLDADKISNMQLRCRRCNVIRRKSHVFGGQTNLTAEAGLMWILLKYRPRTQNDFITLCRLYGMTMADIRMEEAWAMAIWLSGNPQVKYELDSPNLKRASEILIWENGAITRKWDSDSIGSTNYRVLHANADYDDILIFLAAGNHPSDTTLSRIRIYGFPISRIPFSHYFEDLPDALAVKYRPPDRKLVPPIPATFEPEAPFGMKLLASSIAKSGQQFQVMVKFGSGQEKSWKFHVMKILGLKVFDIRSTSVSDLSAQLGP